MKAKWTLLVYMAGNNSLSDAAGVDLKEMEKVGSTQKVAVLAFMKQEGGAGARHIKVGKGSSTSDDVGDADSGDPQTVVDFVRWGVKKAPAERYALVLWNHGGGWTPDDLDQLYSQVRGSGNGDGINRHELNRRATQPMARSLFSTTVKEILSQPDEGERQICNDDGTGHSLDTLELGNVVKASVAAAGQKLDLLGMDACLMSTLEVAYQVRGDVGTVVGSEELEPGAGWPYDKILTDLNAKPDMDGAALGNLIVERYIQSYKLKPGQWPVTQCSVDPAKADQFSKSVDALEKALRGSLAQGWPQVMSAQMKSVNFEMELMDLKMFCENLLKTSLDGGVHEAARGVLDALEPGGYVRAKGQLGDKVKKCGGISVYFPTPNRRISPYYKDLQFAKQHRWDNLLGEYRRAVFGGAQP
jgi:hypothetical protein